ncbi:ComEC/Rec2 family competence protein [Caldalkalibacillus salinus]|uniref:ComEC/Rec2 family competence protein n=1 Tax=Caldalkalibacillus salinus TaxID=2803787 RepID=UPI00192341D6|nr:MBL fold metallo-hydrolase [Caldalkalibacillus salinus]
MSICLVLFIGAFTAGQIDHVRDNPYIPNNVQKIPKDGTQVHFIQLTNGEATLVQLEDKRTILIDTGSASSKRQLFKYIEKQDIFTVDELIITNDSDEHAGNLKEVIERYQIDHVYYPYALESFTNTFDWAEHTEHHPLTRDDKVTWNEHTSMHVLHPSEQLSGAPQDNSLVFQLEVGTTHLLFTSDVSEAVELELVEQFDLHSQILKVSDFGSNQSSHADFIAEVDPHIAVIFHRPKFYLHQDVVERLEESWMDVYPLKKHGHLLVVTYRDDYKVYILEDE